MKRKCIQPNFITNTIRTLTQIIHNGHNAKLMISLPIVQRQLIKRNFVTNGIKTIIQTTNIEDNPN